MNKILYKFYTVGIILIFFFGLGYAQLAFFLKNESKSSLRVLEIQATKNDIKQLKRIFVEIRFWERVIFYQGTPEAERQFGILLQTVHQQLDTLPTRVTSPAILDNLSFISQKVTDYETTFNQIVQLETEQRLGVTLLESTYQSLIANIFRSKETTLLRPVFNLSHFQQRYLDRHRQSEYQALKIVLQALERKLLKQQRSDKRLTEYSSRYRELLAHDFQREKKIQLLNENFAKISGQVSTHLQAAIDITNSIVEQETVIATQLRLRLNTSFLISMTLAILGVFLISAYIFRQIINPILALSEVSQNIREGIMSARFTALRKAPDELMELGASFNIMLDTLANREQELANHRDSLEDLVSSRTSKLNEANRSLNQEIASRIEIEKKLQHYADTQIVLLQEVNHRVKNNLVAIISMLHQEQDRAESEGQSDYTVRLNELVGRVTGLLTVHSMLSTSRWEPLQIHQLCEKVIRGSIHAIHSSKTVNIDVSFSDLRINSDQAHYLTIVLNELTTNSIKYGLNNRSSLNIQVTLARKENTITLTYHDDGPGYPSTVLRGEVPGTCIGYNLIYGMVCQSMQGKIELFNKEGATTHISFPAVTS